MNQATLYIYEMPAVLLNTSTRSYSPGGRTRNEAGALIVSPLCFRTRSQISPVRLNMDVDSVTVSSICNPGETMPQMRLAERDKISKAWTCTRSLDRKSCT
jgi:hypothetical protein